MKKKNDSYSRAKEGLLMKCPKCGMVNDHKEMYCTNCHAPLGNTDYRPLPQKKKGLRIFLIVFPIFLIFLLIGGVFGYFFMIRTVCIRATEKIFEYARTLDFSDLDKDKLPEALKEEPNVRILIENALKDQLKATPFGETIPVDDLDLDPIIDEIMEDGAFEITDTQLSWNRCIVKVKTSNKDFSKLPEALINLMQKDLTDPNSDLWQALGRQIESIFDLKQIFQDDSSSKDKSVDWGKIILSYYDKSKDSLPNLEKEGQITYGFDGMDITGWTIKDYDRDLIRGFYGLEIPDALFDQFLEGLDSSQE